MRVTTPTRADQINKVVQGLGIGLVLTFMGLVSIRGYWGYIADSEFWSSGLASRFDALWRAPWFFSRLLFHAPLAAAQTFATNASELHSAARLVMIANAWLIALLTYKVAFRLSGSLGSALLATLLLVSNPLFINHGYRIRADLVSCTLLLLFFWFLLKRNVSPIGWLAGLTSLMLTTPKAIILLIPLLSWLSPSSLLKGLLPRWKMGLALAFGAVVCAVTIYSEFWAFFLMSFKSNPVTPPYWSFARFRYLINGVSRSWPLFLLVAVSAFMCFRQPHCPPQIKRVGAFLVTLSVLVVLYPDKMPFFLASTIPFFCIFASLSASFRQPTWARFALLLLLGYSLASGVHFWRKGLQLNSNDEQFAALSGLEKLMAANPEARCFDGLGLIPARFYPDRFLGPNQDHLNIATLEELRRQPPEFIFYVARLYYLGPEFGDFLDATYRDLGSGLHVRRDYAATIPSGIEPRRHLIHIFKFDGDI